jgi:hypothetical protein
VRAECIDIDNLYTPTPKQVRLHQSDCDELLYGGAAGGGKSHAAVMDAFLTCLQFPGIEAWLFRRTYSELQDTLIKIARSVIPKQLATYSANRHELAFVNGSMMRFRHCNTVDDVYNYMGAEMNALYIDELTHFPKPVYDYLKTRVRANTALGIRPFIRNFSNPGSIGHAWVKAYFVDPHPEGGDHTIEIKSELTGKTMKRKIGYIPATVLDNPHISQGYIYELENKPKALREALLLGKWDAFEGQVFIEWVNEPNLKPAAGETIDLRRPTGTHVIHPFEIPTHWPIWMSYDHGYEKPFSVGWWAIDQEHDTTYRVREWYGSAGMANVGLQLQIDQIAKGIKETETMVFPRAFITRVGDPHIWDEDGGESIGRAFQRNGLYFKKGDNTRFAGKMQLHYRLRMREDGRPKLYVFSSCRDYIRTIPALAYNPLASGAKAEDIDTKGEDHQYDDTRYFLMEFKVAAYEPPKQSGVWTPGKIDPFASNQRAAGGKYAPR